MIFYDLGLAAVLDPLCCWSPILPMPQLLGKKCKENMVLCLTVHRKNCLCCTELKKHFILSTKIRHTSKKLNQCFCHQKASVSWTAASPTGQISHSCLSCTVLWALIHIGDMHFTDSLIIINLYEQWMRRCNWGFVFHMVMQIRCISCAFLCYFSFHKESIWDKTLWTADRRKTSSRFTVPTCGWRWW